MPVDTQKLLDQIGKADRLDEVLDAILQSLTDAADGMHQEMSKLIAERSRIAQERDLAVIREERLRAATKLLMDDLRALKDAPAEADTAEIEAHLHAARELVERGTNH